MKKTNKINKLTVEEIVKFLLKEDKNETIEGKLIKNKLIRELYKQLGNPKREDFQDEYETANCYSWDKFSGYTKEIAILSEEYMENENASPTEWRIAKASETKLRIVERYTRDNWHCTVQAFNVLCSKYKKHPEYKNIWVEFYSSRDCNKYRYVIENVE